MNLDWQHERFAASPECIADVPQARWCFDPAEALIHLDPHVGSPGGSADVQVLAVRWRPRTALEVTYGWRESGRQELVTVRFDSIRQRRAEGGGPSGRRGGGTNMTVTRLADDAELPGIAAVLDGQATPEGTHPIDGLSVLSYEPGRRATIRIRPSGPGVDVVAKLGGDATGAHERLVTLARAGLPVPMPLGSDAARNLRFEVFVPGDDFWRALAADGPAATAAAFEALICLHRHPPPARISGHDAAGALARTQTVALRRIRRANLPSAPTCAAVVTSLANRLPTALAPVTTHGDFHPGNVILTGAGATLVDLDDVGAGDPAFDIAMFTSRLVLWGLLQSTAPTGIGALVASAPERYADHAGVALDPSRHAWYLSLLLVGRQIKTAITHAAPDLEQIGVRLVTLADLIARTTTVTPEMIDTTFA